MHMWGNSANNSITGTSRPATCCAVAVVLTRSLALVGPTPSTGLAQLVPCPPRRP